MKVAYVRVSAADQNEARQVEGLRGYKIERWYIEKASARNTDRPKLQELLDFIRQGDVLYIHDFSRLARSTADLLRLVELLEQKGVALVSSKENIDTATPAGRLMLAMIGAINEFERATLLERQREGIAIAKAAGKYKGRKKITRADLPRFDVLYERYMRREISKSRMAKELGVSRPTLDGMMNPYKGINEAILKNHHPQNNENN